MAKKAKKSSVKTTVRSEGLFSGGVQTRRATLQELLKGFKYEVEVSGSLDGLPDEVWDRITAMVLFGIQAKYGLRRPGEIRIYGPNSESELNFRLIDVVKELVEEAEEFELNVAVKTQESILDGWLRVLRECVELVEGKVESLREGA